MSPRNMAMLKVLAAVLAWGGSFIATKVALREVSPATIIWLRFGMGVLILAAVVARRRQLSLPRRGEVAGFAFLGFLGITFHQWLQANGLVTAQASTTAWIVATTPVFTALLGWLVLKEKLTWVKAGGIALAALGVLLVVTNGDLGSVTRGSFGTTGDFLILISAPNWAVFSVLSRRSLKEHPPAWMMLWVMLFGWLFSSVLLAAGPGFGELARLSPAGWLGVLFLGVFCTGMAYIFWYDGLAVLAASEASAFVYLEPLVTVVVAALLLAEPMLLASILGGAVILMGVTLVQR